MRPWTAPPTRAAWPPSGSFNGATALRPWTAAKLRRSFSTPDTGFNGATALRPWTALVLAALAPGLLGFNGATALRPWTGLPRAPMPTPGQGFNGATALRPWTACTSARSATSGQGFNGATALRPWTAGAPRRAHVPQPMASMGPRPCGRGRSAIRSAAMRQYSGLQWGHGLAAVDGRSWPIVACQPAGLQWGHGLAAVDGYAGLPYITQDCSRFNGATALRPWTAARPSESAVSSGGFNGATALRPWTAVDDIERNLAPACFNGATALRPWTVGRLPRAVRPLQASMGPRPCGRGRVGAQRPLLPGNPASMGPRPCGRGRAKTCCPPTRPLSGFNGATALRPWTAAPRSAPSIGPWPGFNGATALRPWTGGGAGIAARDQGVLQWGHGLAAVDGLWVL